MWVRPDAAARLSQVAKTLGISEKDITSPHAHGRRSPAPPNDYMIEGGGFPKVIARRKAALDREDDMRHDFYGPGLSL